MTWSGAITVLESHMAAAGTAFSQQGGESLPARKTAAWYYTGTTDCALIPPTLTDHPYDETLEVRFYWPVSTRAAIPARTLENEVESVTRTFLARIFADIDLGANVEHVEVGDATAGWLDIDGSAWRIVTIPLTLGFTDVEPIAR